jgi:prepilin-type N-terminal cleavage/methylation domain-containing protein
VRRCAPGSRRRGFTLIELFLVAAIISVLTLLAAPRYLAAVERFRADAAARRLVADIVLLRTRARALSSAQSMSFTAGAGVGAYTISGMNDPDHPAADYTVDLTADPYRAAITDARFGANGGTKLTFGGYGVPPAGGGGAVTIAVGASRRVVVVDGDSGEVTVQ